VRFAFVPAVIAAVLLGATGCSIGDVFAGDSATVSGSATAPVETIGSAAIKDGKHFGFIQSAGTAPGTIAFDEAEFLTGADAAAAAAAAGEEAFDYFVKNDAKAYLALPVADGVTVTHVSCKGSGCKEGVKGDFTAFAASFAGDPSAYTLEDPYRASHSQYWVTTSGGVVTAIDEMYLP
jgi:hypothetical protein